MTTEERLRPLQFFLAKSGVYTVSLVLPGSKNFHCDCTAFKRKPTADCVHISYVREKVDANGVYPIQISKRAPETEILVALKAPLSEYKEFLLKYAKVEVL